MKDTEQEIEAQKIKVKLLWSILAYGKKYLGSLFDYSVSLSY